MFVAGGDTPPDFTRILIDWHQRNRSWMLRWEPTDGDLYFIEHQQPRSLRAEEIATDLLDDERVQTALTALASPAGQAIETAVAQLYLSSVQASLLTEALTVAWNVARDENRPVWQRVEVLVVAACLVLVVGVFVIVVKHRSAHRNED